VHSSVSGLCITKLDVLDGLETIRICSGYRVRGELLPGPPLFADAYAEVDPVYEEMPGWHESTIGVREHAALPPNARHYLDRVQELLQVPVELISTGAERDQTIVLRHPFDSPR
jgi:adenylosuccinate synthase